MDLSFLPSHHLWIFIWIYLSSNFHELYFSIPPPADTCPGSGALQKLRVTVSELQGQGLAANLSAAKPAAGFPTQSVSPPPHPAANSGTHSETLRYLSLMSPFKRQTGAWVSWQLLFSEAQGARLWINHSSKTTPPSTLPHRKQETLRGAPFFSVRMSRTV